MSRTLKNIILFLFTAFTLSSCWAPRCPMETCRSKYEHQHGDFVSGVFSSRNKIFPERYHFLWDKNKGEENPDTELQTVDGVKRTKARKKFPWERW
ncbi:hypothetical protein SAMN06298216_4050 [Spirosomataceae bacterium TFI 002]|nr:hypothetical protein SAMN06298216_4050 [Spirosomataceae bacterium TFI 002]